MKSLQGAALYSHKRKLARDNEQRQNRELKRAAFDKMNAVYKSQKAVTRLERFGQTMQAYTGIVRSSLTIALYGAPIVVLTTCVVRVVFWILF